MDHRPGGVPLRIVFHRRWRPSTSKTIQIYILFYIIALLHPVDSLPILDTGGCIVTHCDENSHSGQLYSAKLTEASPSSLGPSIVYPNVNPNSIGLECMNITAEQLHEQFSRMRASMLKVICLSVRDSNLTTLSYLPQGTHELKKLHISNTSIDLEVLKEGSESLDQLTTLEIINEKISNIPQNFFKEMKSLKELKLENDELASLDGDAFHNLDDSLELLNLRRNRFNRFPTAVKNLAQLAVLDLSDNDIVIDTQENDLPEKLEPLLNLRELSMNRINWVRCFAPEKLKSQEVIVFERDEFCQRGAVSGVAQFRPNPDHSIPLIVCISAAMAYLFRLKVL